MKTKVRLRIIDWAAVSTLPASASVGQQKLASRAVESAFGYKRRSGASRFTSALGPAPDIRTLNFCSWRYCGRALTNPGRLLLTHNGLYRRIDLPFSCA